MSPVIVDDGSAIEGVAPDQHQATQTSTTEAPITGRPRTMTTTEEIDSTIIRPGSVRINVKGAFIVDPDSSSPKDPAAAAATGRISPTHHETSDIRLPNHTAVVSHIAVDIGGSLIKLVYFSREAHSKEPGGRLNFLNFETDRIDDCIEFMRHLKDKQQTLNGSQPGALSVMATGGGAFKFYDKIRHVLGVDVLREDEMECLIIGLDFFITEIPREVSYSETDPMHFASPSDDIYPYLLVNIGSGVSMLKVSGPRQYQRVGGTSLGGGTLWGLLSLLTGARSFDEMLDAAERGDNSKVDMLVFRMKREAEHEAEDHGGLHNGDSSAAASDAARHPLDAEHDAAHAAPFSGGDISRSLLYAISNNIGQIAYLQSQIHNLSHIYFGGSFIRGHRQTINTLSYAIKFWSQGAKQAYFLRHEGYLGAVGAFLKRQPRNWGRRGSFEDDVGLEGRLRQRARGHDPEMQDLVDDYAEDSGGS
ncbi:hypothetical protein BN1708_005417 [Verticillium longisporum]|uniref:Pantothenate kinase n=2 Tax=Verticillium longisporum TaxID=100787 RepID=A0A0G4MAW1_VERLO|nr:hypothetical protein BN1708_005417 [Verticillium longisporum]